MDEEEIKEAIEYALRNKICQNCRFFEYEFDASDGHCKSEEFLSNVGTEPTTLLFVKETFGCRFHLFKK